MNDLDKELEKAVLAVRDNVIAWRRHIHANPELSYQENETADFIETLLKSFGGMELSRPTPTSVVARLNGPVPGKTVALRADIDALAVTELNGLDFVSKKPGVMHACGHDSHAAMLLGAAKVLSGFKDRIHGEVRFIFQHAEEIPPGGAVELVKAGVMKGVDSIIGLHVFNQISAGTATFLAGPLTADGVNCTVTIQGKGGHSAMPELSVDPVAVGAQVVVSLQHIVARELSAFENVVVSATCFNTPGNAPNATPDHVTLSINARGATSDFRQKIPIAIERIVTGVCALYGAQCALEFDYLYPAVINDGAVTETIKSMTQRIYGKDAATVAKPTLAGEDFSAYLSEAPGCFIFMGTGNEALGCTFPNHHPRFNIDESALSRGVGILTHGAFELLGTNP